MGNLHKFFQTMEILNSIAQETLSKAALELLRLSLSGDPSQQELDDFLAGWDIEAAPIAEPILMSYVMKMHPELVFPEAIRPRLNGLISFCRYQYKSSAADCQSAFPAVPPRSCVFPPARSGR